MPQMDQIRKYRITSPTLVLIAEDGRHLLHTLPNGSIVKVDLKVFGDGNVVNVNWAGKEVMMFTQDLRSKARLIDDYQHGNNGGG